MSEALEIQNLRVEYSHKDQKTIAVQDVSLSLRSGEFFSLLGPNGAGKTSIISALVGLVPFQAGEIKIFGSPASSLEAKRLIGYVPQELVSYGFFNVNEVLRFTSGYFGIRKNQARIDDLLERLQLSAFKYKLVSSLSGGMKRRLSIAKALLHQPRLLLLDEPSAGVDVELRAILWDFARELNQEGMTILLTTHYLEEAERLCERTAILNKGKLVMCKPTADILKEMGEGSLEEAFLKLIRQENLK